MADDKPSYLTSTLSQLAVGSVVAFASGAALSAIGIVWFKLPLDTAKAIMEPFSVLLNMFGAAYLAVRRSGGANGTAQEPPKPV